MLLILRKRMIRVLDLVDRFENRLNSSSVAHSVLSRDDSMTSKRMCKGKWIVLYIDF